MLGNELVTIDAETLMATPFEKTMFIVEDLIPQGVGILCGSSKIGKSWLMLWLGLQVAKGNPVWDSPTLACDVLYLCLEDTYNRIQNRLYYLTEEAPENLRFAVISEQLGGGLEEQITSFLKKYPNTKFVIIDTLQKIRNTKAASGKNGMYGDDYDDICALKSIADEKNISIMTGAVDTAYLLKRTTATSDTATLTAKGRDIEMQQLKLRFEERVWELTEKKSEEEMKNEAIPPFLFRLVDFVKSRQEWTGTATELVEAMGESEVNHISVTRLISHFYYDILVPMGVTYDTKRTGSKRLIMLKFNEKNDGNDRNDSCDS